MRRKFFFCLLFSLLAYGGENLIPNPDFQNNFAGWWKNSKQITIQTDQAEQQYLCCQADPTQPTQRLIRLLPELSPEELANNLFNLSFQAQVSNLQGVVTVKIRQMDVNERSLSYHTVRFCQYDTDPAWQTISRDYKMHKDTAQIGIYIDFSYLSENDLFCLKELSLRKKEISGQK